VSRHARRAARGQADALERAPNQVRGTWIAWLSADDLLKPGGLRTLFDAGPEDAEAVFFGDSQTIDASGRVVKRNSAGPLQHERLLRHGQYVLSRALLVCESCSSTWQFRRERTYCIDDATSSSAPW
jgi:hypothetical protein